MTTKKTKTKITGIRKIERKARVPHTDPPKFRMVTEYEARVSFGLQPARRCAGDHKVPRWFWAGQGYPPRCDCGARLGPEVKKKLVRTKTFRGDEGSQALSEAKKWRARAIADHDREKPLFKAPASAKVTVAAYAETYLANRKSETQGSSPSLDIRTWWRYRQFLESDILPIIGTVALDDLRPSHVKGLLQELLRQGKSSSTAMHAKRVLNKMLEDAVADDDVSLELNPAAGVRIERTKAEKPKVPYLDAQGLLDHCTGRDERWRLPLALSIATGARRGEVLGVLRRNVKLDGAVARVRVDGSLRFNPEKRTVERRSGSKTPSSTRTLVVAWEPAVRLLREALDRPPRIDKANDVVCSDASGRPPNPDQFSKAFKRIAARAGLDDRATLKSLRDSVATFLLNDGATPAEVAAQLGHADNGELALRVYVAEEKEEHRESTGPRLGRAMGGVGVG